MPDREREPLDGLHQGNIVLVTAGNQPEGLGFAIAKEFASEGAARVFITSRQIGGTVDSIILPGIREVAYYDGFEVECIQADLSQRPDVEKVISTIRERTKRLDILINNAGVTEQDFDATGTFFTLPWETMDQIVRVNLMAPVMLTRLAFDRRAGVFPREGGVVGNIGSVVGKFGNRAGEVYAATKGGLIAFTTSAALDLARVNSRIFTVNGGFFETRMTGRLGEHMPYVSAAIPAKRPGTPYEMARAVVSLAGPDFDYLNGQSIDLDGGLGGAYAGIGGLRDARLLAATQLPST